MISMYTQEFLDVQRKKGWGQGVSLGSFLSSRLKGKAKQYQSRYHKNLELHLIEMEREGLVVRALSVGKVETFYPVETMYTAALRDLWNVAGIEEYNNIPNAKVETAIKFVKAKYKMESEMLSFGFDEFLDTNGFLA